MRLAGLSLARRREKTTAHQDIWDYFSKQKELDEYLLMFEEVP